MLLRGRRCRDPVPVVTQSVNGGYSCYSFGEEGGDGDVEGWGGGEGEFV